MNGFPLHWHELVEVCRVDEGSLAVFVDGSRRVLSTGEMVIIGPQRIHGFEGLGDAGSVTMLQFGLDVVSVPAGFVSDDPASSPVYSGLYTVVPLLSGGSAAKMSACVSEISSEFAAHRPGYRASVRARLLDLTVLLLRSAGDAGVLHTIRDGAGDSRRHETLERVLSYVQQHATEPISLDDAAAAASMSSSHFSRFFHRETGRTFQQYLARIRVSLAEQLLYQTDLPVQEVAVRSGFGSSSTFNRLFQRYTGRNPRSCRTGSA